jgi:hypothetical protein
LSAPRRIPACTSRPSRGATSCAIQTPPRPLLDAPASDDTRVYPISKPHPWRTKREQHAEYFAFYRKISLSDAAASGYFTSACGPLVWRGQYFVCEPAQSLIHRAHIVRDGTRLRLERVKGEEQSEFLASRDSRGFIP